MHIDAEKDQLDGTKWHELDALDGTHNPSVPGSIPGRPTTIYQVGRKIRASLGVVFGEIDKGRAEIAGVPAELLQRFSKRTEQVERAFQRKLADFYAREGRDPTPKERGALGREAAEDTRGHKTGSAVIDLRTRWFTEAAAVGGADRRYTEAMDEVPGFLGSETVAPQLPDQPEWIVAAR